MIRDLICRQGLDIMSRAGGKALAVIIWFAMGHVCLAGEGVDIPVPRAPIYPGKPIEDEQLSEKTFRASITSAAVHQDRASIIGKVARRILLPGRPIPLIALKDADLVEPGQIAIIIYSAGGIEISAKAMPLQPGKLGDVVACRNIDSGIVVKATVVAEGVVQVEGQ